MGAGAVEGSAMSGGGLLGRPRLSMDNGHMSLGVRRHHDAHVRRRPHHDGVQPGVGAA